jgi:nitroreductase
MAVDEEETIVELYEVMRTTSAVRHFTNDPLPDATLYTILDNARFAPSGGNRQGTRIVIIRDRDTRQALLELTIPAARKYIAQRHAGENPWNTIDPSRVSDDEIAATDVPNSFTTPLLQSAVVCLDLRLAVHSTKNSTASASSEGPRYTRWCGTSCWRRETRASPEPLRPWQWRRNLGSVSCSASRRRTPLPVSFRLANLFTNLVGCRGSTLRS